LQVSKDKQFLEADGETIMVDIVEMARTGHLTKVFTGEPVDPVKMDQLLELIRSAPSSLNLQPGLFLVASTPKGKEPIAKAMAGTYKANLPKLHAASHIVVFCCRMTLPKDYLDEVVEQSTRDGKFSSPESKAMWLDVMKFGIDMHTYDRKALSHWLEKQIYLALGVALVGAANLGLDVCPLEGFEQDVLDQELNLRDRGYTSIVLLAVGHRASNDYALGTPKSRLPASRVIEYLDGSQLLSRA
jgi:nitroreductase/dihydropteridine reductase